MSYFVSPPDETSWEFDVDDFRARLGEWEDIEIREDARDPSSPNMLEWVLPMRFGSVFGALDHSAQIIHLDGFLGDCALFALWLRGMVPGYVELLFYDENYSADVALVSFTREADLVRAFGS
jgi:hypothetical protein